MEMFYTTHARLRMVQRYINHEEVMNCLTKGIFDEAKDGRIVATYDKVRVILAVDSEQDSVVVVTAIPSKEFEKEVVQYMKLHKVSYKVATKQLKRVA